VYLNILVHANKFSSFTLVDLKTNVYSNTLENKGLFIYENMQTLIKEFIWYKTKKDIKY